MSGFIVPSLKTAMLWLFAIMIVCFVIGAVLVVLESDKPDHNIQKNINFYYPVQGIEKAQFDLEVDTGSIIINPDEESEIVSGTVFFEGILPEPCLSHTIMNGTANFVIDREKNILHDLMGGEENWKINLGKKIPANLDIQLGTGDIIFNSGDTEIKNVKIENGAGSLFLDIHEWEGENLDVSIETGIGDLTMIFPDNPYIVINRDQGVVNSIISGFSVSDNGYIHNGSSVNNSTINVSIIQGIGELKLKTIPEKN